MTAALTRLRKRRDTNDICFPFFFPVAFLLAIFVVVVWQVGPWISHDVRRLHQSISLPNSEQNRAAYRSLGDLLLCLVLTLFDDHCAIFSRTIAISLFSSDIISSSSLIYSSSYAAQSIADNSKGSRNEDRPLVNRRFALLAGLLIARKEG